MKLLITDTNVFFDLINVGALPEFYSLDIDICTTELVINEIKPLEQRNQIDVFIRANELKVYGFTAEEIDSIMSYETTRTFKGITDKSVLWKSDQLKCPLLTGDKKLKNEAEDRGIEVHGSIWVIRTLVDKGFIEKSKGIDFLEQLKLVNTSLPFDKIDELMEEYKK